MKERLNIIIQIFNINKYIKYIIYRHVKLHVNINIYS